MKRRELIKNATLAGLSLPILSTWKKSTVELPPDLCVLFQGDSITDAGRDRARYYANNPSGMGQGYVRHIVTELLGLNPSQNIKFYNRGISGHKVFQLAARWEDDCLMLEPDVLSILIGVNDYWHTLSGGYKGTVRTYEADLRALLDRTQHEFPAIKLIIGEPFVLMKGTAIDPEKWDKDFPEYREVSRNIASDYNAAFVPYQDIFDSALKLGDTAYWCPDGVHPSMAGNYLMANGWLEAFFTLYE